MSEKFYKQFVDLQSSLKFLLSTAGTELYCDPKFTKVVIATNGGIVPGMNVVIKSIVKCLEQEYGVTSIYGVKWGYVGFMEDKDEHFIKLDSNYVTDIQVRGGSILGTSRDIFDLQKVVASLKRHKFT